ncbi:DUF3833 domain-containing protein [Shimia abyssi]|uniref:Uncharacterized protein DUF3833 n=1 Tax=Shimia abyssi TaxID=1662395 RepID=A0A2P8FIT5_9RHOB|nr:DUF3833 domain-containing protein [Shimia abyssi]PSL21634.1 uncharacterized protein DUF3833 [Shimia abyssi]
MSVYWFIAIIALVVIVLAARTRVGFTAQDPAYYSDSGPYFDLTEHLNGPILCEGVIYGPLGRVESTFTANMYGEWDGTSGTLDENFTYNTGNTQSRQWRLTMGENGRFTAEADDIIGTAQGLVSGSSVRMTYKIKLPEEAGGHVLSVVDWLYLTENGTIINRSQMRKFGIKVAELVATMRPDPAEAALGAQQAAE